MIKSKHEQRLKNFPVGDPNFFIKTKCILTTCNYRICTFLMYSCGWKFSLIGFMLMLLRYAISVLIMKKKGQQRVIFTQVTGSIPILYQCT